MGVIALRRNEYAMARREKTDYEAEVLRSLGERIRRARLAQGLTLRELAERVTKGGKFKLSFTALESIEAGRVATPLPKLLYLAEILDIPELLELLPFAETSLRRSIAQMLPEIDDEFLKALLGMLTAHRSRKDRDGA